MSGLWSGWASLGTVLSSEWASLALPGVSVAVGLLVSPLPDSSSWGSWRPLSRQSLLSRDQTCPSSPSPAPGVFSQHFSGTRKDRACQNQGSPLSGSPYTRLRPGELLTTASLRKGPGTYIAVINSKHNRLSRNQLQQVKPASAMSVRKDEIPQQSSAPLEGSLQQKLCLPGEEEKTHCTPTKDTECQCKPGPFRGEDAPEFCQKCSTRCPDGKVMVTHCTPWSNIKCVDQEAGLFDECWHKVISFSSIWPHQTLSNWFRPTTRPRVDVVLGLSYAVFPDSLN
ncbi:hypothetical protein MJT46_012345 [Ovis ammon polii x Ovis aries]|nr:hypothetical protein MJT46_012345 [Ovis ammon polii x Ovis aries]